jgi:hypothetical protein
MDEKTVEVKLNAIAADLKTEGFGTALIAVAYPDPTCGCGQPDCTGKLGVSFHGRKGALLNSIQSILSAILGTDELAQYGRRLIEHAYHLQSPADRQLHRRRFFRGGSLN